MNLKYLIYLIHSFVTIKGGQEIKIKFPCRNTQEKPTFWPFPGLRCKIQSFGSKRLKDTDDETKRAVQP
jgi:hypothetical protein